MVPAPIELQRGMGSSTIDRKFCSTDRGGACSRSRSAAAAAALNDHRNLAALPLSLPSRARARRADFRRSFPRQTDLLEPPGWRCGCWLTSPFRFSEIVVRRFWFGADDGARAVAADVGFAGSGRWRWCRRRSSYSEVRGHRQQIGNSAALTVGALALARAALRRLRH